MFFLKLSSPTQPLWGSWLKADRKKNAANEKDSNQVFCFHCSKKKTETDTLPLLNKEIKDA